MANRNATSEIKLSFQSTVRNTLDDATVATASHNQTLLSGKINTGVAASQANRAWAVTDQTLASGATIDIDLYDFALFDIGAGLGRDGVGQLLTLEEIVTLIIAQTGGAGQLEIMPWNPIGAIAWVPSLTVANGGALKSGGLLMMHQPGADAFDVQDGVSHVLRLGANGGAVEYSVCILGRHDDEESSSSTESSSTTSSQSASSGSSSSSSSVSSTRSWTSQSTSSSASSTSVSSGSSTSQSSLSSSSSKSSSSSGSTT